MKAKPSMLLKDLIVILKDINEEYPGVTVELSGDAEGNSFGAIHEDYSFILDEKDKMLTIYPAWSTEAD